MATATDGNEWIGPICEGAGWVGVKTIDDLMELYERFAWKHPVCGMLIAHAIERFRYNQLLGAEELMIRAHEWPVPDDFEPGMTWPERQAHDAMLRDPSIA